MIPGGGGQMLAAGGNPGQRIILLQPQRGAAGGNMQGMAGIQPQQLYLIKQPGSQQQQVIDYESSDFGSAHLCKIRNYNSNLENCQSFILCGILVLKIILFPEHFIFMPKPVFTV